MLNEVCAEEVGSAQVINSFDTFLAKQKLIIK